MPTLHVHYLPQFVPESDLADRTTIVVDLLRASSTICRALASGAASVTPLVEVDAARRAVAGASRKEILLGGERGGRRIEGFDLGNSPSEYDASTVFGKRIVFTTTNGAKAIGHARLAARLVIGSILNCQAAVDAVADDPHIDILCAGTDGHVTREDVLAAGALADRLLAIEPRETNSWAEAARREWQELVNTACALSRGIADQLAEELRETQGGRRLMALGLEEDLDACAQLDTLDVAPELDRNSGELR